MRNKRNGSPRISDGMLNAKASQQSGFGGCSKANKGKRAKCDAKEVGKKELFQLRLEVCSDIRECHRKKGFAANF